MNVVLAGPAAFRGRGDIRAGRVPGAGDDEGRRRGSTLAGHEASVDREEEMVALERFEALILGSGAGGKQLAWHLAQSGRRTAVVERQWIGGSCPNVNCMPSKNEIWSANGAYVARHPSEVGTTTRRGAIGMETRRRRKRRM